MSIINYWSELPINEGEFFHHKDWRQHDLLRQYGFAGDLLPAPYAGNILSAKVVFAMINPGLQYGDNSEYIVEKIPEIEDSLIATIYQDMDNLQFPFMFLNPAFSNHPGYVYWNARLGKSMLQFAEKNFCSEEIARHVFADGIATIELVPYHSANYSGNNYSGNIHNILPSSNQARAAFQELSQRCLMIVPRAHKPWGFEKPDHGVIVDGNIVSYFDQAARIGPEDQ